MESKFYIKFLTIVTLLGLFLIPFAQAEEQTRVETAFIYQFTNYLTWPSENSGDSFIISVVGGSSLISELQELAKTKKVRGQKIEVLDVPEAASLKKSQIIILGKPSERVLEEVVKKAKGSNTLIVSFGNGLAEKGAMINFYVEDGKLRFEINRVALEREKIQASSQLLKLARLVD